MCVLTDVRSLSIVAWSDVVGAVSAGAVWHSDQDLLTTQAFG